MSDDTEESGGQEKKSQKYQKSSGPTRLKLETRGGKQVTVLHNLPFTEEEAKALLKGLQEFLACGGSIKESSILLNGDMREKVVDYFESIEKEIVGKSVS